MQREKTPNCSGCRHCPGFDDSIFNALNTISLDALEAFKKNLTYKKGSLIFSEGSLPKGLYCIRSGHVRITQMGFDGKDQIIGMLKNGDILGHRAILGQEKHSCTAKATVETEVCFFSRNSFYRLAENNGKLSLRLAHVMALELASAEKKITSTHQKPVLIRVAESILWLLEKYGEDQSTCAINTAITREELANIAGTTRESATRSLYKLKSLGIIELSAKKIKIVDKKKLDFMTQ